MFVRSGDSWSQQAYLKASNTDAGDFFGGSLALSRDTLAVGAQREDSASGPGDNSANNAGAVYVFSRTGTVWSQQAMLKASNAEAVDNFGLSVALSGDTLAAGAPFEDSGATGTAGGATAEADNGAANAGAIYVFVRSGTAWSQQAYLKTSNNEANDRIGTSLALDGDTLVAGVSLEDSAGVDQSDSSAVSSGAAYVFVRSGSSWRQQAYLKASNTDADDRFGSAVAIDGDVVVVGAPEEASAGDFDPQGDNSAAGAGAAYLFSRAGEAWSQLAYLKPSTVDAEDNFGSDVAISGGAVALGAPGEDSGARGIDGDDSDNSAQGAGAVYVFE